MGVPNLDIALSKQPVAIVITPSKELEYYKLKPHYSHFFVIKKWGIFEIQPDNVLGRSGRTPIYLYDARSAKPINALYAKELDQWARKQGLTKISRKDMRQSNELHRLRVQGADGEALDILKKKENLEQDSIHAEIARINADILKTNEQEVKAGREPIILDPHDYSSFIVDTLASKGVITREEATKLSFRIIRGEITIDEFIAELGRLKEVQIAEPIPVKAGLWLEDYHTYDPSKVMAYIKMSRGLKKRIEQLGLTTIKNLVPIGYIIMIVIGAAIGGAILLSPGTLNQLRSLLGMG